MNDTISKISFADKLAETVKEIKLITNATTKITHFKPHFGRNYNTQLSHFITKTSQTKFSYNDVKNLYLYEKRLRRAMLNREFI